MTPPTLTTARLTLRPATMADFGAYAAFLTTPRSRFMGGPHDVKTAWDWFCNDTAQWTLLDMGALIIERQGRVIGQVAVCGGPIFPEPELGWFLYDSADEGQGFAFEAAAAMRDWVLGPRGLATVVAYIDPMNAASIRLAERLGGQRDERAATPDGIATGVWRLHAGLRLETKRLVLRKPHMGDLSECVAFWSSPRSHMMGGPWTAEVTATNLQEVIDLWDLRGFGLFVVTLKGSDKAVGLMGAWQPADYPEPEIGWSLWDISLEGKGLAFEAVAVARDWFFATSGQITAVSYTHPDNMRSHRLCERLGAVYDPDTVQIDPPERIYRHSAGGARA
jgi:RimJ/RimL family protein N-acetyltransferase